MTKLSNEEELVILRLAEVISRELMKHKIALSREREK
jgi:hypothetical protein